MSSDDDHYLGSYLSEILPTIGLDIETYAPYVTGYADDNSDDDDGESLDELIELLRASSESHVDDVEVWNEFRKEISQRRQDYRAGEDMRKEMQVLQIQADTQASLLREIELSQQNALEIEARKQAELENDKPENMSEAKLALLTKYGYENDEAAGDDDEDTDAPITNRDQAAALSLQKSLKLKSVKGQTKEDARKETKQMKADKTAKKEERRKKAAKRERQA